MDAHSSEVIDDLWDEIKPDVVHISNALLLGLVRSVKKGLNVPVVCTLQDEDTWIDKMEPNAAAEIWRVMSEKAKYADGFIAVSRYYRDVMKKNYGRN